MSLEPLGLRSPLQARVNSFMQAVHEFMKAVPGRVKAPTPLSPKFSTATPNHRASGHISGPRPLIPMGNSYVHPLTQVWYLVGSLLGQSPH